MNPRRLLAPLFLFALFLTLASPQIFAGDFDPVITTAKVVAKNPDGTLLVSAIPAIWQKPSPHLTYTDRNTGAQFPKMMKLVTFDIEGKRYTAGWSTGETGKEYRYLLQPKDGESCAILKVWDGEKVIYPQ